MGYTVPTTEGGSPLPLSGYTFTWPGEMYLGYTFEDLIQKFGYRIQDAIRTPIFGQSGLDDETMKKKTKWWKFWNRDLRDAYKWYTGIVVYKDTPKTVPPSEVPTLAPEHSENSAVKKKIKLPSPRMKPKVQETLTMDHIKTLYGDKPVNPNFYKTIDIKEETEKHAGTDNITDPKTPGYIYAPFVVVNRTESSPEYDKFMKKYHRQHSCCPNCRSNHLQTTLMGYPLYMDKIEEYKDLNSVHCEECGFTGIRHDLVPKKRKPKIHEHTFELDGGPCLKCGKTVAEMIYEDITNYKNNKK